jgi:hypothetical protein
MYTIVTDCADWMGLYRDGELVGQGHSFDAQDVLELLKIEHEVIIPDSEWLAKMGGLPEKLSDVAGNPEE